MDFWDQVLSPGSLAVGVVCALLGGLVGHLLTRAAKRTDDREALIKDVAEKYRHLREINKTSGPDGLMKAGVCRLRDASEVERAVSIIKNFGNKDPLAPLRERLLGKDVHHFFTVLRDGRLNMHQAKDLEQALQETRQLQ